MKVLAPDDRPDPFAGRAGVCEHMFVNSDAQRIAILDAALACHPAALRVGAKDRETVDWLARAGLLIDAEDGTVAPTRAAIHFDELLNT